MNANVYGVISAVEDARCAKELLVDTYGEHGYRKIMERIRENIDRFKQELSERSEIDIALAIAIVEFQKGNELAHALYRLWVFEQLGVLE